MAEAYVILNDDYVVSGETRTAVTVTANGNAEVSTSEKKIGTGSFASDTILDFLSGNLNTAIGTGEFTWECYIKLDSLSADGSVLEIGTGNPELSLSLGSVNKKVIISDLGLESTTNLSPFIWYHIAVTRDSNDRIDLWIDGISEDNTTSSYDFSDTAFKIGEIADGSSGVLFSYIDEFRISSVARYTSAFTPTTTAFQTDSDTLLLLHMDGTDGSTDFPDDATIEDYLADDYVGAAEDLYVEAGYIIDIVPITGSASLNSQCSVVSSVNIVKELSAQLLTETTLTVSGSIIKQLSASAQTASSVSVNANFTAAPIADIQSEAQIASDISATRQISATLDSALNAQIQANATVSPGADIQSSFSLSGLGDKFVGISATLETAGDEIVWDEAGTWYEPTSEIWGPLFDVNVDLIVQGTANIAGNFTVDAAGVITAVADITVDSFGAVSTNANSILSLDANLNTETAVDALAFTSTDVIDFVISTEANVSVKGIAVILSQPVQLNSQTTVTTNGNFTADLSSSFVSQTAVTLTGNEFRIRFGGSDIQTQASIDIDAKRIRDVIANLQSQGALTVKSNPIYAAYEEILLSRADLSSNGGRLRLLSATLDAFATTVSTLTIYNIDPFRVYTVQSEARITQIVPDTRVFLLLDENRINTIERETRHINLGSETRQLTVQHNPLVELETILDRRQG